MAIKGSWSRDAIDTRLTFEYNRTAFDAHTNTSTIEWKLYVTFLTKDVTRATYTSNVTLSDIVQPARTSTVSGSKGTPLLINSGVVQLTHSGGPNDPQTRVLAVNTDTACDYSSDALYVSDFKTALGYYTYIDPGYPNATIAAVSPTQITDEIADITFTISLPKPSLTTALKVGIDFGAGYSYTNLSPNTTSFTYALTQSDYIAIQEHTDVKSFPIYFNLQSTVDGISYTRTTQSTCTFVNAEPAFTVAIVDMNTAMSNLTGDATNRFVRGYSNAQVTLTSSPKKGAYIVSEKIVCGDQSLEYGSGTLYGVESSEFVITVTDSRGYTTTQTITKTLVNYIPLTCNLEVDLPSPSGSTTVRVKGNCFYGSFGNKTNTLTVRYRYAVSGSAYSNWYSSTISIVNNNTYSVNFSVTGLDYTQGYTFEAQAVDLIETTTSVEVKVKSTPIFDWGENDFNFNVPVNFNMGFTQPNSALKQLWNGQQQMADASTSITLIEPISEQATGIVLVFTPYNSTTGLANDEKLQSFFVSKKVVQAMPSKMHTFMLIDGGNFATVGAKSLYIADGKITGYANNSTSGGASNSTGSIKYDNTKFVLRWILGV